jgi:hypothetical protein
MQERWKLKRHLAVVAMFLLCGLAAGCSGKERTIFSPPAGVGPAQAPAVRIIVPADGTTFHAHADIRLLALATPHGTALGPDDDLSKEFGDSAKWDLVQDRGDTYSVEFLAGTNSLGLQTGGEVSAREKPKPGQAEFMHMVLVGYPVVEWVWHDAPAGTYALTARVTNQAGAATASAPVKITVLP